MMDTKMDIIKDMTPVMMTVTQDINNYIRRFFYGDGKRNYK